MSTTLDPVRLRFLLQRLHHEFPGVDYSILVRSVMLVERTSDPDENLEHYCERVHDMIREQAEQECNSSVLRNAKITLQRSFAGSID